MLAALVRGVTYLLWRLIDELAPRPEPPAGVRVTRGRLESWWPLTGTFRSSQHGSATTRAAPGSADPPARARSNRFHHGSCRETCPRRARPARVPGQHVFGDHSRHQGALVGKKQVMLQVSHVL